MAPTTYIVSSTADYSTEEPISRTYQYRKVMKPLLERKRRARINRCLDELKELMVTTLQSEGENVSKLEKADILELTVRHLHTLKRQHQLVIPSEQSCTDRFRAGFSQCAQEVTQFISGAAAATAPAAAEPGVIEPTAGKRLLQHLGACVRQMDHQQEAVPPPMYSPPSSPVSHQNNHGNQAPQQLQHQQQQEHYRQPFNPQELRHQDNKSPRVMWRPW